MIRTALLACLLLTTTACATGRDSALDNSTWQIVRIDGAPSASPQAELAFSDRNLSASAGCNRMNGSWRTEGQRLLTGRLAQTEMWCESPGLMAQEQSLATLLAAAPRYRLAGDRLALRSGAHSAELRRQR